MLTSRGTDGSVARFVMQAASSEIKQAWFDDVVQILETQRNFLNGAGTGENLESYLRGRSFDPFSSPL